MARFELFQHTLQSAAETLTDAHPEERSQLVSGQAEQPHFAGMLKDLVLDHFAGQRPATAINVASGAPSLGNSVIAWSLRS